MRELLVLRHAKSDWHAGQLADHARPLNARGRGAAPRMGRFLLDQQWLPAQVLCSTAVRTRETLALLIACWPQPPLTTFCDDIYEASPRQLLAVLRRHAETPGRCLIIGHNPGLEGLVEHLAGPGALGQSGGLPTCALVRLQLHPQDPWEAASARVLHFQRVRALDE